MQANHVYADHYTFDTSLLPLLQLIDLYQRLTKRCAVCYDNNSVRLTSGTNFLQHFVNQFHLFVYFNPSFSFPLSPFITTSLIRRHTCSSVCRLLIILREKSQIALFSMPRLISGIDFLLHFVNQFHLFMLISTHSLFSTFSIHCPFTLSL